MHTVPVWTEDRRELWRRLSEHPIGTTGCDFDFAARLAHEHGWSADVARGAIEEYRRFCFLSIVAGHVVTPSDAVDEVWHLHLTYTRDYWETFCPHVLGAPLHHEPTRGGRDESARHRRQYAQTLAAYQAWFGAPPENYWPHVSRAFGAGKAYRRVDLKAAIVLPRPRLPSRRAWAFAAAGAALLAVAPLINAQSLGPLDWNGPSFLGFYLLLLVAGAVLAIVLRRQLRDTGATHNAVNLDPWQTAYLAGGAARAVDASVAELLARKVAYMDVADDKFHVDNPSGLEPPLDIVAREARKPVALKLLVVRLRAAFEPLRAKLEQRGLVLTRAQAWRVGALSALPFALTAALGIAKIMIGISRDRPIAFLVILVIVTAVIAVALFFNRPERSVAGDAVLASLRQRHAHATRAPRDSDIGLAVALAGTAVLSGTAFAAYHEVRNPPGSSGDGGSGGSSCSSGDGGDGGGGGGCGGCGGGGD